jgi:hypothetical protein
MRAILGEVREKEEAWRVVRRKLLEANNGTELNLSVDFKLRRDRRDERTKRDVECGCEIWQERDVSFRANKNKSAAQESQG